MKKRKKIGKRFVALLLIFTMCAGMSVTVLAKYAPTLTKNPKIIKLKPNTWVNYKVFDGKFNSNGKNTRITYKITVPSNGTVTFSLKEAAKNAVWIDLFIVKKPYNLPFTGIDEIDDIPGFVSIVSLAGKSSRTVPVSLKKGTYYIGGEGRIKFKYTFTPNATKISKLKNNSSKKINVKWTKKANVTGYQIKYSTSGKFTSSKTKSITVKGSAKGSKNISRLKKGKTYYVRVRTYNTISKKNYYSKWSAVKKVKITK